MAKCTQCGVRNPEDRYTCYGCGQWLEATPPAAVWQAEGQSAVGAGYPQRDAGPERKQGGDSSPTEPA